MDGIKRKRIDKGKEEKQKKKMKKGKYNII